MRWDHLTAPPDEGVPDRTAPAATLPLALPGATVRTFDTPGFAGMTYYEVRAKSIINRVPSASRVPFEWTINPYRGCSHACVYCLAGDTPILMADGRAKSISELEPGERIYGTEGEGAHRRYVVTRVLDKWPTIKRAYRITLEDGTTLVASGDHRLLSVGGWTYVTCGMSGVGRRPYLTTDTRLIGTGRFAQPPKETSDYRLGYLCGMVRRTLVDDEARSRTQRFLTDAAITDPIRWPPQPSDGWRLGFLAGIFDAAGSCSRGTLSIGTSNDRLLDETTAALTHFGFTWTLEDPGPANRVRHIRLTGGLPAQLRFFHRTDPAIARKRSIEGVTLKNQAALRVESVENLGLEVPLWDITTVTGDFIANGVVSHNCFARNTHSYLDLDTGLDFDRRVVVKVNAGDLVRRELAAARWKGGHIAMGTNVDCYQRAEGRYRLMPQILAALRDFANPFSILTKGTLILRDLPLLRQAGAVTRVGVSYSVGFVDEDLWRSVESGTPSPRRRLDAVRTLTDAGFEVGVLMAPILPGLTDTDESIETTVAAIAAAGAASVTPLALHLRPGAREWYAAWLAREFPHLVSRYRKLFRGGSYLPQSYQRELADRVYAAARRHGVHRAERGAARQVPPAPPPAPEQLTLL